VGVNEGGPARAAQVVRALGAQFGYSERADDIFNRDPNPKGGLMGRRGNQTFLKNQKAQKRVARANAKRAEKQARRDEKVARTNSGDLTSGPPIEWSEAGDRPELAEAKAAAEGEANGADNDADDTDDDSDDDDPDDTDEGDATVTAVGGSPRSAER
jgi:hypothetical protein